MEVILVNTGYVLMLIALLIGDILWLRATLMAAQSFIIAYNVVIANPTVTFWNAVFVSINGIQVVRLILKRRGIKIPEELQDLHAHVFSIMTPREFLTFWAKGREVAASDGILVKEGSIPATLMLVTHGEATVAKSGHTLAHLKRGQFVAEMSYVAAGPASADVVAIPGATYHEWDRAWLDQLKKSDRDLYTKVQSILGYDLVEKVRSANLSPAH